MAQPTKRGIVSTVERLEDARGPSLATSDGYRALARRSGGGDVRPRDGFAGDIEAMVRGESVHLGVVTERELSALGACGFVVRKVGSSPNNDYAVVSVEPPDDVKTTPSMAVEEARASAELVGE